MKRKVAGKGDLSKAARFNMVGPKDLLQKLHYNMKLVGRPQSRAAAAYAALDAATTAWSLVDWCCEALWEDMKSISESRLRKIFHKPKKEDFDRLRRDFDAKVRDDMLAEIPQLSACRMMATAHKHFEVRLRPIEVHNSVIDMRSDQLDPSTGQVIREKSFVAVVFWEGNAETAEQFFADVYVRVGEFLRKNHLESRTTYLEEFPDEKRG